MTMRRLWRAAGLCRRCTELILNRNLANVFLLFYDGLKMNFRSWLPVVKPSVTRLRVKRVTYQQSTILVR